MVQKKYSLSDSPNTNDDLRSDIFAYQSTRDGWPVDVWRYVQTGIKYRLLKISDLKIPELKYSGYVLHFVAVATACYYTCHAPIQFVEEVEDNYMDHLSVFFHAYGFDVNGFPLFTISYEKEHSHHCQIFSHKCCFPI